MAFRSFLGENTTRKGFHTTYSSKSATVEETEAVIEVETSQTDTTIVHPTDKPINEALDTANATIALQSEQIDALKRQLEAINPILTALPELRRQIARDAAADVGEILSAITRRVVGQSIALHPTALAHIVTQALGAIPGDDEIWISLPPGSQESIKMLFEEGRTLHLREDDALTSGCRISTKNATLEATLETAMDSVDAAIAEWIASDPALGTEG